MYREEADRLQLLITQKDGYIFCCTSFIHWCNDPTVKAAEANINVLLVIYDERRGRINETNEMSESAESEKKQSTKICLKVFRVSSVERWQEHVRESRAVDSNIKS